MLKHKPELACKMAGCPFTNTRVAATNHCTLTQGCGLGTGVGNVNGQPVTKKVSASVTTAACVHITTAPT